MIERMLNRFKLTTRSRVGQTAALLAAFALLAPESSSGYTLLAVFAHPDDETAVAGLLAKYAAEGHVVRVAYTTSGQDGNANTSLSKGEELGRVREGEARCASRALGVGDPIFLGFVDGTTTVRETIDEVSAKVRATIERVKPDVVVTFGPDGYSGHPDNRIAGAATSEVFFQRGLLQHHPRKLYHILYPESKFPDGPPSFIGTRRPFRRVSEGFVTTVVDGSDYADEIAGAVQCNETQFNEQRMRELTTMLVDLMDGEVHLRLAGSDVAPVTGTETSVFERLP